MIRRNPFSIASALTVFGLLPAWIEFWWRQRSPREFILVGAPIIVALAVALGVIAMRRGERVGWLATVTAIALPIAVFVWMNFVGNP